MKKRKADETRTMERRQFLGVSAAAGASAALTGCMPGPQVQTQALPEPTRPGHAACDVHRRNITWAMPSKHLNTLWTLLWPRVAARTWKGETFWPVASPENPVEIGGNFLIDEIDWFLQTIPLGATTPGVGSPTFLRLIGELKDFLGRQARPPIRLLGEGGYDFYITEEGVDLWAPPPPDKPFRRHLMSMYEYRRTGRPPIAIGKVKVTAGILPEAPVGPGQIEVMTPDDFVGFCMAQQDGFQVCGAVAGWTLAIDMAVGSINAGVATVAQKRAELQANITAFLASDRVERSDQERVLAPINAIARDEIAYFTRLRVVLPDLTPHPRRARLEQIEYDYKRRVINEQEARDALIELIRVVQPPPAGRGAPPPTAGGAPLPDQLRVEALLDILRREGPPEFGLLKYEFTRLFPQEPRCAPAPASFYECKIEMERCWWMSGSVYRGILEQFPRFVAERWGDDLERSWEEVTPERDVKMDWLGSPILKRDIESRMETQLPVRMRFEFLAARPSGSSATTANDETLDVTAAAEALWDATQLMITNSGFFFPSEIGNAGHAPEGVELLTEIIHGRAGNPVFTDSSFSE